MGHDIGDYAAWASEEFGALMTSGQKGMKGELDRVNHGELFVLHMLSENESPILPSELSAALRSSTARISALLGALEKKGQIFRDIDRNNRRNILVTITAAGRERVEGELSMISAALISIFNEMGERDTVDFIRLIKRFAEISRRHMTECER